MCRSRGVLPDGAHLRLYFLQKPSFPRASLFTPGEESTDTASASVTPSSDAGGSPHGGPTPVAQPTPETRSLLTSAMPNVPATGDAAGRSSTANIPIPTATTGIAGGGTPAIHGKRPGGATPAVDGAAAEKQSKRAMLERVADPMCMAQTDPELLDIYADILQASATFQCSRQCCCQAVCCSPAVCG